MHRCRSDLNLASKSERWCWILPVRIPVWRLLLPSKRYQTLRLPCTALSPSTSRGTALGLSLLYLTTASPQTCRNLICFWSSSRFGWSWPVASGVIRRAWHCNHICLIFLKNQNKYLALCYFWGQAIAPLSTSCNWLAGFLWVSHDREAWGSMGTLRQNIEATTANTLSVFWEFSIPLWSS